MISDLDISEAEMDAAQERARLIEKRSNVGVTKRLIVGCSFLCAIGFVLVMFVGGGEKVETGAVNSLESFWETSSVDDEQERDKKFTISTDEVIEEATLKPAGPIEFVEPEPITDNDIDSDHLNKIRALADRMYDLEALLAQTQNENKELNRKLESVSNHERDNTEKEHVSSILYDKTAPLHKQEAELAANDVYNEIQETPIELSDVSGQGQDDVAFREQIKRVTSGASLVYSEKLIDNDKTLVQGTVIEAVIETAIISDTPGLLKGRVAYDIYGHSGREVLLQKGSILIGHYNSQTNAGDSRLEIIWIRAISPDGVSAELDGYGVDSLGRGGVAGKVDNDFFSRFSKAALTSILTLGRQQESTSISLDGNNDIAADPVTLALNRGSLIRLRQGASVAVLVNRDIYFE